MMEHKVNGTECRNGYEGGLSMFLTLSLLSDDCEELYQRCIYNKYQSAYFGNLLFHLI